MIIYYRISDGSYKKNRFEYATKENCLKNFLRNAFNSQLDKLYIFADNVKDETYQNIDKWIDSYKNVEIIRSHGGSSAAGFRIVFGEAITQNIEESVYFCEDDYAHIAGSRDVLLEGLTIADYVTLYNHPDKYIPASKGGNMYIEDDGTEATRIGKTQSSYWALTNSTTMTFAASVRVLKEDAEIWRKHTSGSYPRDFDCFIELRNMGRRLVQPIPTKSTHCEIAWASSLIGTGEKDWNEVLLK